MANGQDERDDDDATEGTLLPADFDYGSRPIVDILVPATLPDKLKGKYSEAERAKLAKLYADGKLTRETRVVKISAKKLNQKTDELWPFYAYLPTDNASMVAMSNNLVRQRPWQFYDDDEKAKLVAKDEAKAKLDKTWGQIDYWEYGYYLNFTQPIRQMLDDAAGGEEKAINKSVDLQMKQNLFDDRDEARAWVIQQRAKQAAKRDAEIAKAAAAAQTEQTQ